LYLVLFEADKNIGWFDVHMDVASQVNGLQSSQHLQIKTLQYWKKIQLSNGQASAAGGRTDKKTFVGRCQAFCVQEMITCFAISQTVEISKFPPHARRSWLKSFQNKLVTMANIEPDK
jgi:hypothetical protein